MFENDFWIFCYFYLLIQVPYADFYPDLHQVFHYCVCMEQLHEHIPVPNAAAEAISRLERAGHSAWIVGGYVRNALLGIESEDIDIATSAPCEQTARLFSDAGFRTVPTGMEHGTATVFIDGVPCEITTYRTEGGYSDGRHPDRVRFTDSIEADLARRDFTVNAIAYHPDRGILDPFRGTDDLSEGIVRAVGDPRERFSEDGLRVLRCIRFASQLDFDIETNTQKAATACAGMLDRISSERIEREFRKTLCGKAAARIIMQQMGIIGSFIPEALPLVGLDQRSPHHMYDALEHTARTVELTPPTPVLRYAAFLHDIGKPASMTIDETGRGHFKGHPELSANMARSILERLRLSRQEIKRICLLVRLHDLQVPITPYGAKHLLGMADNDPEAFRELCALKKADALSHAPNHRERARQADELKTILEAILENNEAYRIRDLAINGTDLLGMGIEAGPELGRILAETLEDVIAENIPNERESLLRFIAQKL